MKDLRPYVCTYDDCDTGNQLYDSMKDWLGHEAQMHQANVNLRQCPFCPETSNAHHIAAHLRRLALFALPRSNNLEQADEDDGSDKAHRDLASDDTRLALSSLSSEDESLADEKVKHELEAPPFTTHWSREDQADFKELLLIYGRDWSRIAARMETKTPFMVSLVASNDSCSSRTTFD